MRRAAHGQIVSENGFVGAAFKTKQVTWQTLPAAADDIAVDEEFVMELGGILEAPMTGNLAAVAVGNAVYIRTTDNVLQLAAQALTAAVLNAATLPVGVVTEIDVTRTPDVARINANAANYVKGTMP